MYPNAAKGVKRIFISEILSLIAEIGAIVAIITTLLSIATAASESEVDPVVGIFASDAYVGLTVTGLVTIIAAVLAVIAFIMQLVGIVNASKDEGAFKISLFAVIASIVFTIIGGFFPQTSIVSKIFSALTTLSQLFVTVFIIQGIINLAKKIGNSAVEKKGNTLLKIIACIYIISVIIYIVTGIIGGAPIIANVLSIGSSVLQIVAYLLFLSVLSNAKKMLA